MGQKVEINSPKDSVRRGLGLLPEDRKNQGVLLEMSIKVNTTLSSLNQISKVGNSCRLIAVRHQEAVGSTPRILAVQSASQLFRPTSTVMLPTKVKRYLKIILKLVVIFAVVVNQTRHIIFRQSSQ